MSDFIGASDRFAIMSQFQEHRKEVIEEARRLRDISDAMMSMLQTYGYCPQVTDHFIGESDESCVVFLCEEESGPKSVILITDPVTGEAFLHADTDEGTQILNAQHLVNYLTGADPALDELRQKLHEDD